MPDLVKLSKVLKDLSDFCKDTEIDLDDVINLLEIVVDLLKTLNPKKKPVAHKY